MQFLLLATLSCTHSRLFIDLLPVLYLYPLYQTNCPRPSTLYWRNANLGRSSWLITAPRKMRLRKPRKCANLSWKGTSRRTLHIRVSCSDGLVKKASHLHYRTAISALSQLVGPTCYSPCACPTLHSGTRHTRPSCTCTCVCSHISSHTCVSIFALRWLSGTHPHHSRISMSCVRQCRWLYQLRLH